MDAMGAVLNRYGFKYFCFNFLPNSTQKFEDVLLANRLPVAWLKLYVEEQFVHADPSVPTLQKDGSAYRWKELPTILSESPAQSRWCNVRWIFGLSDGFVIPRRSIATAMIGQWIARRKRRRR